jgi:transposase-like protein
MIERKRYRIIKCPRCQAYQIADSRNKSKTCSQCSRRFETLDLPVLASAKDAREARAIVMELKMPRTTAAEPKMI